MFWIAVQLVDFIYNHKLTLLLLVWFLGMTNYILYAYWYKKYKPYTNSFRVPVSIVVPVFKEEPELLQKCLSSIRTQMKVDDELIISFDGIPATCADKYLVWIAEQYGKKIIKEHGGKRSALAHGCYMARNAIIVTIDSDTILCPNCLDMLIMPFVNRRIGAVSAYQRIFNADMNLASKFADYNELMAHGFIQKATSAAGNVAVLFGRCLAIRKEVWVKIGERYLNKRCFGRQVESGDDNDITLLTISEGYQTFMQSSAKITSDCPRGFWKRLRQQYRFSRSSMRTTISDWLNNPKLIMSAKLGFLNQIDAVIFPFLIMVVWLEWLKNIIYGGGSMFIVLSTPVLFLSTFVTLAMTLGLSNLPVLEHKKDIPVWIVYIFYTWSVINVMNIIAALTIFRENRNMVQYSRNTS